MNWFFDLHGSKSSPTLMDDSTLWRNFPRTLLQHEKKTAAFNLFFCSTSRRALYRVKKTSLHLSLCTLSRSFFITMAKKFADVSREKF